MFSIVRRSDPTLDGIINGAFRNAWANANDGEYSSGDAADAGHARCTTFGPSDATHG
jgi:hypothetical protein